MCTTVITPTAKGSSTTCHSSIWPGFSTLNHAPTPDGVQPVLGLSADPLRVEVRLGQVAGERRADGGDEGNHPGHPGQRPVAAPGRHPELAPQVDHHEREEQLDAPQVERVDEAPQRRDVPPGRAADGEQAAGRHDDGQCRQGEHAEDVDPGGDVGRLAVREGLPGRDRALDALPQGAGPVVVALGALRARGYRGGGAQVRPN